MIGLLVVFTLFGISSLFAYSIFQPVAEAVRGRQWTTTFYLSDFFSLPFLLAIPLLFVASARRWGDLVPVNILGFILVAVFAYVWWRGAVTLSRIGIRHTGRRCLFLGILVPIAFIGSAVGVPMLILMPFSFQSITWLTITGWLTGVAATPIVALCCRRAVRWVLSGQSDDS